MYIEWKWLACLVAHRISLEMNADGSSIAKRLLARPYQFRPCFVTIALRLPTGVGGRKGGVEKSFGPI